MKKLLILICFFCSPAVAETHLKAQEQAGEIGRGCWEKAFENNPSSTAEMRKAGRHAVECLEAEIKKQVQMGFESDKQEKILGSIQKASVGVSETYWMIFNENKYCSGHCGTMGHVANTPHQAELLEEILAKLIFLNLNKTGY